MIAQRLVEFDRDNVASQRFLCFIQYRSAATAAELGELIEQRNY